MFSRRTSRIRTLLLKLHCFGRWWHGALGTQGRNRTAPRDGCGYLRNYPTLFQVGQCYLDAEYNVNNRSTCLAPEVKRK